MRKDSFIILIMVLILLLCSCSIVQNHGISKDAIISYATENAGLLEECAQELYEICSENPYNDCQIWPLEGNIMQIKRFYYSTSPIIETFESEKLQQLFDESGFLWIDVKPHAVQFQYRGYGLGSNTTYYMVGYVPSGKVSYLLGYNDQMQFVEKNGGYFGSLPGSDDTFFYYSISNKLFYCEAHF